MSESGEHDLPPITPIPDGPEADEPGHETIATLDKTATESPLLTKYLWTRRAQVTEPTEFARSLGVELRDSRNPSRADKVMANLALLSVVGLGHFAIGAAMNDGDEKPASDIPVVTTEGPIPNENALVQLDKAATVETAHPSEVASFAEQLARKVSEAAQKEGTLSTGVEYLDDDPENTRAICDTTIVVTPESKETYSMAFECQLNPGGEPVFTTTELARVAGYADDYKDEQSIMVSKREDDWYIYTNVIGPDGKRVATEYNTSPDTPTKEHTEIDTLNGKEYLSRRLPLTPDLFPQLVAMGTKFADNALQGKPIADNPLTAI